MRYRRIAYRESFNFDTGGITMLTPCPYGTGCRVATDDCWHCKHFISLYQSGEVECSTPLQFSKESKQLDLFPSALMQKGVQAADGKAARLSNKATSARCVGIQRILRRKPHGWQQTLINGRRRTENRRMINYTAETGNEPTIKTNMVSNDLTAEL